MAHYWMMNGVKEKSRKQSKILGTKWTKWKHNTTKTLGHIKSSSQWGVYSLKRLH